MTATYPISNCFPDYDLGSQLVCHESDDYLGFLRQPTYAPLRRIAGAYASFFVLYIDVGHYKNAALWFTTVLVWCSAWLIEIVEEGLFLAGLPMKVYWDPGATLVAQPLMIAVGVALGWLYVITTNPRPMLTPEASLAWPRRVLQSALIAFAPSFPLLIRSEVELFGDREWARFDWWLAVVAQFTVVVGVAVWNRLSDGRLESAQWGVFVASLALLWGMCVGFYHTGYMISVLAALYVALFLVLLSSSGWARQQRTIEKSRYRRMVRRRADYDETQRGRAIYAYEWLT